MIVCDNCENATDDCFLVDGECKHFELKHEQAKAKEAKVRTLKSLNMKPDNATVVVELTVEVVTSSWGPECTIEQAVSQAVQSAEMSLSKAIGGDRTMRVVSAKAVRVICEAKKS